MSQRTFMQGIDALSAATFKAAGLADSGTYQLGAGPVVPCQAILVDRGVQDFGDDAAPVGAYRTLVTLYRSDVPNPQRFGRVVIGEGDSVETFTLDACVRADESLQQWVVSHG